MSYYQKKYIAYEILKECKHRDFSALGGNNANIRALNVRCLFDFQRALLLINWKKHKQNLYVSCAKLKNIPSFTFSPRKRSGETSGWFKEEYNSLIESYDILFDFDKKPEDSWEDLIEEVKELKAYLDDYSVPYFLLFSGGKGFQIVVDGRYVPIKEIKDGNVFPHKKIVEDIKETLDLRFLDLANNGVSSRLRKLPYSLVSDKIALPLSDSQLDNFKIEHMEVNYVLTNVTPLVRRGNLEREGTKENWEKFIKLFTFK